MITPLRLAWGLCLWGIFLILNGMVSELARDRVVKERLETWSSESERLAQVGFAHALARLRVEPTWSGSLAPFGVDSQVCSVVTDNFGRSPVAGYGPDGTTWIPPYSMLLRATIRDEEPPRAELVYATTAGFRGPIFNAGVLQAPWQPFTAPLSPAPAASSGRVTKDGTLLPGSYDVVTVARRVRVHLQPDRMGARTYRLRRLILEPGAKIAVANVKACPAVLYIDELLELQGANEANWSNGEPGPAAMLQVYGGGSATLRARDSHRLSLVLALPLVTLEGVTLHGAVLGTRVELSKAEVIFEAKLKGVPLQGLGPLTLSPHRTVTGTPKQAPPRAP